MLSHLAIALQLSYLLSLSLKLRRAQIQFSSNSIHRLLHVPIDVARTQCLLPGGHRRLPDSKFLTQGVSVQQLHSKASSMVPQTVLTSNNVIPILPHSQRLLVADRSTT